MSNPGPLRTEADRLRRRAAELAEEQERHPSKANLRRAFDAEDRADAADRAAYKEDQEDDADPIANPSAGVRCPKCGHGPLSVDARSGSGFAAHCPSCGAVGHLAKSGVELRPEGFKKNPTTFGLTQRSAAVEKYKEFHRHDPKKLVELECAIPAKLCKIGKATWVTYRSSKVDPETLKAPRAPVDYIHEHDAGVELYLPGHLVEGASADTDTPKKFREVTALVKLGSCLGFGFVDEGEASEAKTGSPLPDLYTTADGRCLYVVQGGRSPRVLAMMWGGGLGVEARGIVG